MTFYDKMKKYKYSFFLNNTYESIIFLDSCLYTSAKCNFICLP